MRKTLVYSVIGLLLVVGAPAQAADDLHGLFQEKCKMCHSGYEDLAKIHLTIKSGRLVGLFTNRDIGEFMTKHGRLTKDEAQKVTERMLQIRSGIESGGSKGKQRRGGQGRKDK